MKRLAPRLSVSFFVLTLLIFCAAAFADETPFEVVYKGEERLDITPGSAVSAVFLVRNPGETKLILELSAEIPADWNIVTIDDRIDIEPLDFQVAIVSFTAPRSTPAGFYEVTFRIRSEDPASPIVSQTVTCAVRDAVDIEIKEASTSNYIIAGQEILNTFSIHNRSNKPIRLEIEVESSEGYPLSVMGYSGSFMTLGIDEIREIDVYGATRADIGRLLRHRTRVFAYILTPDGERDTSQPVLRGESGTDILPKKTIAGDRYHRLPITWSVKQLNEFDPGWSGEAELRLNGSGTLDEAGNHDIDFTLTKRLDLPPTAITNPGDLYRLIYANPRFSVLFGDGSFELSRLTEESRRGQGVSIEVNLDPFDIETYYHQSYWSDPVQHYIAGRFGYRLPDMRYPDSTRYRVDAQILGTIQRNIMLSVDQVFLPVPLLSLSLETGVGANVDGTVDFAVSAGVSGNHGWIAYAAEALYAGPSYPGQINDMTFLTSNLDLRLFGNLLKIETLFNIRRLNILNSADLPDTPLTWELGLKPSIVVPGAKTDLRAGWSIASRRDLLSGQYDTLNNRIQLEVAQPIDILQLSFLADVQISRDRLDAGTLVDQLYLLGAGFTPSRNQEYEFFVSYDGEHLSGAEDIHGLSWGTSVSAEIRDLTVGFELENRNEYPTERSSLDVGLDLNLRFGEFGQLTAGGEYSLALGPAGADHSGKATVQYSGSFLLPVSRKSGVGAVSGTVRNVLNDEPLPNIIIRLGENAAVSDRRGRFLFPAVPPGEHYIDIDSSLARIDLVPIMATPMKIVVQEREDTNVDVPMGILGSVTGQVIRYAFVDNADEFTQVGPGNSGFDELAEDNGSNDSDAGSRGTGPGPEYEVVGPATGAIVEIRNGEELFRRVVDKNGRFSFEDMSPGPWHVEIYPETIGEGFYAADESFDIRISSGERVTLRFDILPIKRTLRIIGGGEL